MFLKESWIELEVICCLFGLFVHTIRLIFVYLTPEHFMTKSLRTLAEFANVKKVVELALSLSCYIISYFFMY